MVLQIGLDQPLELLVHKVLKERKVLKDHKGPKVMSVHRVLKVVSGHKGTLVPKEQ